MEPESEFFEEGRCDDCQLQLAGRAGGHPKLQHVGLMVSPSSSLQGEPGAEGERGPKGDKV